MWRVAMLCIAVVACGSSSSDGQGDANVPPALTPDEAANACVLYGGCMGDGINDCYTDAMPYWTTAEARCVLAAGSDCAAVRACFGLTIVADASCTTRTITCDGSNLVTCADGARSTVACPTASPVIGVGAGSTCVPTSTGALCGDATCSAASATCTGSVASSCLTTKGVSMSIDCADYAQQCVGGACTAAGGGATCAAGTLPRCDGSLIVRCSGGVEVTTDCKTIGRDAICYPGTEPYCGFGDACYPTKGTETCNGNSVTFCAAGVTASVDCTSLGYTRCFGGRCVAF
ncbi:MAG TPA: hypothetical protein VIV40_09775 [Kofleriaceae bacterium]